jgi:hypothetical protein
MPLHLGGFGFGFGSASDRSSAPAPGLRQRFKAQLEQLGSQLCGKIGLAALDVASRCQTGDASSSAGAAAQPRALAVIDGNTSSRTADLDSTAAPLKRMRVAGAEAPPTPLSQQHLSAETSTAPLQLSAELLTTPPSVLQERAALEALQDTTQMTLKRCNDRLASSTEHATKRQRLAYSQLQAQAQNVSAARSAVASAEADSISIEKDLNLTIVEKNKRIADAQQEIKVWTSEIKVATQNKQVAKDAATSKQRERDSLQRTLTYDQGQEESLKRADNQEL